MWREPATRRPACAAEPSEFFQVETLSLAAFQPWALARLGLGWPVRPVTPGVHVQLGDAVGRVLRRRDADVACGLVAKLADRSEFRGDFVKGEANALMSRSPASVGAPAASF
jgi:hypothetical protein